MNHTRRINQLPVADRPREKLTKRGASTLSDFELLEVVIGSGSGVHDVSSIAKQIHKHLSRGTGEITYESLTAVKGVNTATASKLLAALELARRHLVRDAEPLLTIQDVIARMDDIRSKQQEHLVCLSLDGGQRLIAQRTITIGTLDSLPAHPREIFTDPIADRAASIVVAHNHPSGDVLPSNQDIKLTQQLVAAGQLLGITLRDHLILSKTGHFSFRQHHLL